MCRDFRGINARGRGFAKEGNGGKEGNGVKMGAREGKREKESRKAFNKSNKKAHK